MKVEDDEDPEWNKRVVEEDTVYDYEDKDEDEYEDWEGTDTEADDDMSQADELEVSPAAPPSLVSVVLNCFCRRASRVPMWTRKMSYQALQSWNVRQSYA